MLQRVISVTTHDKSPVTSPLYTIPHHSAPCYIGSLWTMTLHSLPLYRHTFGSRCRPLMQTPVWMRWREPGGNRLAWSLDPAFGYTIRDVYSHQSHGHFHMCIHDCTYIVHVYTICDMYTHMYTHMYTCIHNYYTCMCTHIHYVHVHHTACVYICYCVSVFCL